MQHLYLSRDTRYISEFEHSHLDRIVNFEVICVFLLFFSATVHAHDLEVGGFQEDLGRGLAELEVAR